MNTEPATAVPSANAIPPDVMADLEAVVAAVSAGEPIDPVLLKRVRDRGERVREAVYQRHGLLDVAVPAIRELRDS